ncbi:depupylase/deamidase Dop [Quadrisphaera sp. DSM 44207]|uniref:depupylase/deamidase Dop n=1 Tax=Quadrisphaera sp. DSM 44207 TaxID=1881057 RepID=UPI000891577F|nr:depupylase/deamidase Dop [Quadrisphaera sp. DSM 44207]SDQ40489.1 proteasome accessory factor A [Quadrisphaera sp. DSM 44207]
MSVRRVMGIETEYGVSSPGHPETDPVLLSSQVVTAYAAPLGPRGGRPRWDYEDEAPLRDARGFEVARSAAHASQLTDSAREESWAELEDPGSANVVLTNGARLYVDHAHPEYSSPEVTSPLDAVRWDRAGEVVMATAAARIAATPGLGPVRLYKNNTDNKGASYGTHENYLMARSTPFPAIVRALVPFFVARQVVTGAGRVGIGPRGEVAGFQLSQRADYVETEVGLETTLKRPIINTRDEPHATADRYRRLHVIIGDANLCEVATYLKLGTTALVLDLVEAGRAPDVALETPVASLHAVSHDPSLTALLRLADGSRLTAVQLMWRYLEAAAALVAERDGDDADAQTRDVLRRWEQVLTDLEADPMRCAGRLDWVAKLRLLQGFRDREGLEWGSPRLELIDLQYADVDPARGLHSRLRARGAVERLVDENDVEAATSAPPEDTRAWFRGQCLARYGKDVAAASWDSVIFDVPGRGALQRVPMLEPLRGTRAATEALLQRCPDAASLVDALSGA